MTILDEILAHKRTEVEAAKASQSPSAMETGAKEITESPRGFVRALRATAEQNGPAVIAEVKRRSPSKGLIRADFEPVAIAEAYAGAGASCLSVLTDAHFFGGDLGYLQSIRSAVPLPLLRKDFVIDAYQIDEARVAGADAVLLIVSALGQEDLESFYDRATRLGLDVLVEVHDEDELARALATPATLIGVNNRNLKTFEVDLGTTERLAARLPADRDILLIAESGIRTPADVERLRQAGAAGYLVGESLMRERDPGAALAQLRGRVGGSAEFSVPKDLKEKTS